MKNEMFRKVDLEKVKDFFETDFGRYVKNWGIGLVWIAVVLMTLFVIGCFVTWSIPIPTGPSVKDSEGVGIMVRICLIVYSFVILLVTFGGDDDCGY
jgi:hypothetical protein